MVFTPFTTTRDTPHPWSPFNITDYRTYDALRKRYDVHLPDGLTRADAEKGYIRLYRIITIIATDRLNSGIAPSLVWENDLSHDNPLSPVRQELGILYDELFLALARPSPDEKWYWKLLAVRDSMFRHWKCNPKFHSKTSTMILLTICNVAALLDVRLLSLRDGPGRKTAATLVQALPHEWKQLLNRPKKSLHQLHIGHLHRLLQLQFNGTTGSLPQGEHIVYLLLAGEKPYVGRAAVCRTSQRSTPGFGPRWSEHVRELERHIQGTSEDRTRRRYTTLQYHQASGCLNFVVLFRATEALIAAREALAITLTNPRANGNELKHFSEIFRKKRNRGPKQRTRPSESSRRNKRRSELRVQTEQWGMENDTHSKQLDSAHVQNVLKQYATYTKRKEAGTTVKTELSLTFHEVYRNEQIRLGAQGPILIYQLSNMLMFLRGCADPKLFRRISVEKMLLYTNKPIDYCYHMADMCTHMPSYQSKVRAFTVIQDFLRTKHLYLAKNYSVKILSTYDPKFIEK